MTSGMNKGCEKTVSIVLGPPSANAELRQAQERLRIHPEHRVMTPVRPSPTCRPKLVEMAGVSCSSVSTNMLRTGGSSSRSRRRRKSARRRPAVVAGLDQREEDVVLAEEAAGGRNSCQRQQEDQHDDAVAGRLLHQPGEIVDILADDVFAAQSDEDRGTRRGS